MRSARPADAGAAATSAASATARARRPIRALQNVTDGRWTPKTPRRRSQISPERGRGLHGLDDQRHEVVRPAGAPLERIEGATGAIGGAGGAESCDPLGEGVAEARIQLERRRRLLVRGHELVHAHDDPAPVLELPLVAVRRLLDLVLHEADRGDGPTHLVDLAQVGLGLPFDLGGQALDGERPAERVDDVGDAGLVGEDLLGAERDAHGAFGRQSERLVHRIGVQRLAAAQHRGEGLHGDAHDVVLGLLRRQHAARRLGVKAQRLRAGVAGAEPIAHQPRPQPTGRPELGDLLDEVVVGVEEEGELGREVVDGQPGRERGLHIGDRVGEGEGDLLDRGAARFPHVIAGDRDRVPARDVLAAIGEEIGDEPHRRRRGEDVGAAGHVLLEDVVLDGARQARRVHAAPSRHRHVERQQDRGGGVDRHGRRDALERDRLEEIGHVLHGRDGDPHLAHLAPGQGGVGVVAHLRRQVEGHGQPGLPLLEEEPVPLVRLRRRPEPGVLAHRPEPAPIHRRMDAPGERELTGTAEPLTEVAGRHVVRRVGRRPRRSPGGQALGAILVRHGVPYRGMFPCFFGGLLSRLVRNSSSAAQRRARVSRGMITSST